MTESTITLTTPRLLLRQGTLALAEAEVRGGSEFARLLGATVPPDWPPEMLRDALPLFAEWFREHGATPWLSWYAVRLADSRLVASIGFKGAPAEGSAEIGYSLLPAHQGEGLATEMVSALTEWALQQPEVRRVIASVEQSNTASIRVLEKAGFHAAGASPEPDSLLYERLSTTQS